jgi:hypothetical protein
VACCLGWNFRRSYRIFGGAFHDLIKSDIKVLWC